MYVKKNDLDLTL